MTEPATGTADLAVSGLARNPAAPEDLLLRLVAAGTDAVRAGLRQRRQLPPTVQQAMARHPEWRIRAGLAQHPQFDPELLRRLIADPDWRVLYATFNRLGRPLPDDALTDILARIADQPPDGLLTPDEFHEATGRDPRLDRLIAAHPAPRVRRWAATNAAALDEPALAALLADPDPDVRAAANAATAAARRRRQPADLPEHGTWRYWMVLRQPLSRALVDVVLAEGDVAALGYVAANPSTPPDVLRVLLAHPAAEVRRQAAGRADLSAGQLLGLAADPDITVRTAVSVHRGLTEEQRAGIAIDTTGGDHLGPSDWCRTGAHSVDERPPALTDAVPWARSVNPLLRRRAARNPQLPADLVTALAGDPDLCVRVLLAQHHPAAPPALLLRGLLEYHGCGRDRLGELPQFPTAGLARFAGHDDPVVRRLAGLDPDIDPGLAERLCADPDPAVRHTAASCPRLPAARIVALLDDPDLAGHAAANPALPAEHMTRILRYATQRHDT